MSALCQLQLRMLQGMGCMCHLRQVQEAVVAHSARYYKGAPSPPDQLPTLHPLNARALPNNRPASLPAFQPAYCKTALLSYLHKTGLSLQTYQ